MEVLGFGVGMVANVELAMLNVVSQLGRDQGEEPGEELRAIMSGGDGGCLDDDADKARETSLGIPEVDARGRPLACCGVVLRASQRGDDPSIQAPAGGASRKAESSRSKRSTGHLLD